MPHATHSRPVSIAISNGIQLHRDAPDSPRPVVSPPPPSTRLFVSESNIPALPLDSLTAPQHPPEPKAPPCDISITLPVPAPALVIPEIQAQDQPTAQTLTSPPSPVSNPTSALPSPIIVPPSPEQPHRPQVSISTTASYAPPLPRPPQSTFRHVGPSGIAGGRLYTHSPLRPAHPGTATSPGLSAAPGPGVNGTVFRVLVSSAGNSPAGSSPPASPSAGAAPTSPRTFTLGQQTRTSSPLASSSVITLANSGSLPPIPIGQRGGTATPTVSSRLASPAPTTAALPSTPTSSHTIEAPEVPSKGPTPSPTPSTQKTLPTVPQTTPPSRPASLPRHTGHTPTHSNTLPVLRPSQHASSASASRSATPVSTPQRASGSAPYRAGFQPKGVYRSHTDQFLESRARKRESGRVEQRRLERRLDKVCSITILKCFFGRYRP